jgi:hypothetical protein
MADEYIQQLRRMMSEIEDRREYLTDNEYLTEMNNCLRSYLTYHQERCTCTESLFECYHYPRLFQNCRNKDVILQYAPLISIMVPDHQIPADFRLQLEIQHEPYDRDILIRTMRYLLELSLVSSYTSDKVICAFSIFHLAFKHYGLLEESPKLRDVVLRKLNEFESHEESTFILENFDFSIFGIDFNPVPIWAGELRSPVAPSFFS